MVSSDSSALATRMTGTSIGRVMAGTLLHPSLTVEAGRMIQCGTTEELDTTVPGMIGCMVSQDVYSFDGKVKLIDKGAKVVGEDSGGIKAGQARVFALWNRLDQFGRRDGRFEQPRHERSRERRHPRPGRFPLFGTVRPGDRNLDHFRHRRRGRSVRRQQGQQRQHEPEFRQHVEYV